MGSCLLLHRILFQQAVSAPAFNPLWEVVLIAAANRAGSPVAKPFFNPLRGVTFIAAYRTKYHLAFNPLREVVLLTVGNFWRNDIRHVPFNTLRGIMFIFCNCSKGRRTLSTPYGK